jgi:uncharacterized protein (TIGR00375 family)
MPIAYIDMHLHSRFSRACSKNITVETLEKAAIQKGLNIIGVSDFTHPIWFKEVKSNLKEINETGLYQYKSERVNFLFTTEVSLIYNQNGETRKIHHLILAPNIEIAEQITSWLKTKGRVDYDGRPIFGFSSPELIENMMSISKDIMIIPAHCLLPNEPVQTNKGMMPIEKLTESSFVLTHKGNYKRVEKVMKRKYDGELVGLKPSCFNSFTFFTPEHPIYIIKSHKSCKNIPHTTCKPTCSYLKRGCQNPKFKGYKLKWTKASEINRNDICAFPIYKKVKDIRFINIINFLSSKIYLEDEYVKPRKEKMFIKNLGVKRNIEVSKEFCRLIGYYLAEGYTTRDHIAFSFNKNETEYINDVRKLLRRIFGKLINVRLKSDKNGILIEIHSKILVDFFKTFYKSTPYRAQNKYLPELFLKLPIEKQKQILLGWWRGDVGVTSSIDIINQMRLILFRLKIIPTITVTTKEAMNKKGKEIDGRRIIAKNDSYCISYLCFFDRNLDLLKLKEFRKYKSKLDRRKGYFDENYVYLPITGICKRKYSGYVYNLEVKDDNSFLTKNFTVHNCMTPWFGIFGSKSGFDSVEECFQDQSNHVYAIESGLSADPRMLWRISSLDKYTIVSNSDSHSANIIRMGRELNVMEMTEFSYKNIVEAIKNKDKNKFLFTCEVPPEEGKYHWDGHRIHNVSLDPKEAIKYHNLCPVCGKPLTIGVLHRVDELADREEGFVPRNAIPFKSLLPLSELIAEFYSTQPFSKKVWEESTKLTKEFGSELNVLLNADEERLKILADEKLAEIIIRNREGKLKVQPGYDGVYGKLILNGNVAKKQSQRSIDSYI